MCGLFGVVIATHDHPVVHDIVLALGKRSVERGKDSSGLAYVTDTGDTTITRNRGSFPRGLSLVRHAKHRDAARVILGHTRWATQGNTIDTTNMSPMPVGRLVGTHNGDVAVPSIPGYRDLPDPTGGTDSERLYQAINGEASVVGISKMLSQTEGRAALAWVDAATPGVLYLARAALSPLAMAYDRHDNLYWASNPDWFRQIDSDLDGAAGFHTITMMAEGTVAAINTTTREVEAMERFTPTCRSKDLRIANVAAWRGFTPEDRKADEDTLLHRVAAAPAPAPTTASQGGWRHSDPAPALGTYSHEDYWWDLDEMLPDVADQAEDFLILWEDGGRDECIRQEFLDAHSIDEQDELAFSWDLPDRAVVIELRRRFTTGY